jgi:hypothetical protein
VAVVETKVKASTAAAAVSGLALWALGRYAFKGSGVPDVVASWVYVIVPGLITFGAGWLAKHTTVAADLPLALAGTAVTVTNLGGLARGVARPVIAVDTSAAEAQLAATAEKLTPPAAGT